MAMLPRLLQPFQAWVPGKLQVIFNCNGLDMTYI